MFKLSKATGAKVVNNLDYPDAKDLGSADLVDEHKIETDKWIFIEGCKNPKVTILFRRGSQRVVDEAERSMHDDLMVIKDVLCSDDILDVTRIENQALQINKEQFELSGVITNAISDCKNQHRSEPLHKQKKCKNSLTATLRKYLD